MDIKSSPIKTNTFQVRQQQSIDNSNLSDSMNIRIAEGQQSPIRMADLTNTKQLINKCFRDYNMDQQICPRQFNRSNTDFTKCQKNTADKLTDQSSNVSSEVSAQYVIRSQRQPHVTQSAVSKSIVNYRAFEVKVDQIFRDLSCEKGDKILELLEKTSKPSTKTFKMTPPLKPLTQNPETCLFTQTKKTDYSVSSSSILHQLESALRSQPEEEVNFYKKSSLNAVKAVG